MATDGSHESLTFLDRRNFPNPHLIYRRLRETDPVQWDAVHPGGAWVLTRYEDIVSVLRDARASSDRFALYRFVYKGSEGEQAFDDTMSRMMLFLDPPRHTRLRSLVAKAFTPRAVEALRPRIRAVTDACLDRVEGAGNMDIIAELAGPLPVTVIAELLGVPAEREASLKQWSAAITNFIGNLKGLGRAIEAETQFRAYLGEVIHERRARPGADLISALLSAEQDGERLAEADIVATCMLLLNAGHETTTHLIGNGIRALLQHPGQAQLLREEPTLLPAAIEELLRFDGPAQIVSRIAKEDIDIGGKRISAGQLVLCLVAAANRDPARFADPDRLDVRRSDNRHLAFALGSHFCLGAPLARLEGEIAIGAVLRRFPRLRLASDELSWQPNYLLRGLTALRVAFD